jgi:hypothetical protein
MANKRGAIELSMTTVVIIVLAMTMLILGLTLVKNIFSGATSNVQSINEKVRGEINKLFDEDTLAKSVVYLPEQKATVKQGSNFGVAFAIRNLDSTDGKFTYATTVDSGANTCPKSENPLKWLYGAAGTRDLKSGEISYPYFIIRVTPTPNTPLCTARFNLKIMKDGELYHSNFFDIQIV